MKRLLANSRRCLLACLIVALLVFTIVAHVSLISSPRVAALVNEATEKRMIEFSRLFSGDKRRPLNPLLEALRRLLQKSANRRQGNGPRFHVATLRGAP